MRSLLVSCLVIGVAYSIVEFTNSALYDIYDFRAVDEVHLAKCDNGCLIFAATLGEGFVQYPEGLDPFAMNLIVLNNDDGTGISIAKLAKQQNNNKQKIPMTVTGQGNISVVNKNDPTEGLPAWDIVLYVIEKARADAISYEVYDVYYNSDWSGEAPVYITPKSEIVTFLSAYYYRLQAAKNPQENSVTATLAGFDNAIDNNKDGCPYVYKTPATPSFPGFTLMGTPQIMSLSFGKKNAIQLQIDIKYTSVRDIGVDGFITSPGWNGCTKKNNGGIQTFRSREDAPTDTFILKNDDDQFHVSIDVLPNFDGKHKLIVTEQSMINPKVITGTALQHLDYPNANYLLVDFQNMRLDQGFLLRYSSTMNPRTTTTGPSTEPPNTSPLTSPTLPPSTTSSGIRANGCMLSILLLSLLLR